MISARPLWSILVPSVPSRVGRYLQGLLAELVRQTEPYRPAVEVLCCVDNKLRSIGEKRALLVQMARGEYVSMVDDDDEVTAIYVEQIVNTLRENPRVQLVTFRQHVVVIGPYGGDCKVTFGLGNPDEPMRRKYREWVDIKRSPCHVCVWDRKIALSAPFPTSSYGEDYVWSKVAARSVERAIALPHVLHRYYHDATTSEASAEVGG